MTSKTGKSSAPALGDWVREVEEREPKGLGRGGVVISVADSTIVAEGGSADCDPCARIKNMMAPMQMMPSVKAKRYPRGDWEE